VAGGVAFNPTKAAFSLAEVWDARFFHDMTFEQLYARERAGPALGPVTYAVGGQAPYQHVGDGGLFDNLGTESLTTLLLKHGRRRRLRSCRPRRPRLWWWPRRAA